MEPFDAITEEDKEFMKLYIKEYGGAEIYDLKPIFKCWNKNKRTLFKGFGNKLRISIPVEIKRNTKQYYEQLQKLYTPVALYDHEEAQEFLRELRHRPDYLCGYYQNEFLGSVIEHILKNYHWKMADTFLRLISYTNVESGKTCREYCFPGLITVGQGVKIAKAIQKVLKAINYSRMDLFEEWRNAISNLNSNKTIKTNMVFSIHPIDYMTMSDNNCNWTSCMSWQSNGAYSVGTLEMMNSNVAVVAYLESKTPFNVFDMTVAPNKFWRALMFVHRDILLIGKNYPYQSEEISKRALQELSLILKENLDWSYSFQNQLYKDLRFGSNDFVREKLSRYKMKYKGRETRHKIICYTHLMYNDMIEDSFCSYWCYRNKPKRTLFLNLSGPATCLCCGEPIHEKWDRASEVDCNRKLCRDCLDGACDHCGKVIQKGFYQEYYRIPTINKRTPVRVCKDCALNEYRYSVYFNKFCSYESINAQYYNKVVLFDDSQNKITIPHWAVLGLEAGKVSYYDRIPSYINSCDTEFSLRWLKNCGKTREDLRNCTETIKVKEEMLDEYCK